MNAKLKMNMKLSIITITAILLLALASCTNPVSSSLSAADPVPVPETGIDVDSAIGLVAGLTLDSDILLSYPGVSVSEDAEGNATIEWVEGLSGTALKGDENGDFIRIADGTLPELTVAGSVEVWVKPELNAVNYYTGILHKGDNPEVITPEWYFVDETWTMLFHADSKPYFFVVTESEDGTVTPVSLMADTAIVKGEWSHLAATWIYDELSKDTVIKLYVNGEVVVSKTLNGIGPVRDTDGDLIIGSQLPVPYNGSDYYTFKGLIDEVSLYNVARSADEIMADYQVYASVL